MSKLSVEITMLKPGDCDKYDCPVWCVGNYADAITDIRFVRATTLRDYRYLRNALQKYVVSGEED